MDNVLRHPVTSRDCASWARAATALGAVERHARKSPRILEWTNGDLISQRHAICSSIAELAEQIDLALTRLGAIDLEIGRRLPSSPPPLPEAP